MKHEVVQAVDGCTDTFAEQRYRENEVFGISGFEAIGRVNKSEYDIYNRLYVVLKVCEKFNKFDLQPFYSNMCEMAFLLVI